MIQRAIAIGIGLFGAASGAQADVLDDARDFHRQGALDQALEAYDEVARTADDPGTRGIARNNACVILTGRGRLDDARAYCEEALDLRRNADDLRGVARTMNNLARVHEAAGEIARARKLHVEALSINRQRDDLAGQVVNHLNLGVLETNARSFAAALTHYADANAVLVAAQDAPWSGRQRALLALNRGVVLEQIGAYREALVELDLALALAPEAAPARVADIEVNRGVVLRNLGDPAGALQAYAQAQSVFEARDDPVAVANVALNRAILAWQDQRDPIKAADVAALAREMSLASQDVHAIRDAAYVQARILLDANRTDDAAMARRDLPKVAASAVMAADLDARIARARGQMDAALNHALSALERIESQRSELGTQTMQQRLLQDRRSAYALTIDILFAQFQERGTVALAERALNIVARAKALGLGENTVTPSIEPRPPGNIAYLEIFDAGQKVYLWSRHASAVHWRREDAAALRSAAAVAIDALRQNQAPPAQALNTLGTLLNDLPDDVDEQVIAPDGVFGRLPFEPVLAHRDSKPVTDTVVRYVATTTSTDNVVVPAAKKASPPKLLALSSPDVPSVASAHPALSRLTKLSSVGKELTAFIGKFGEHVQVLSGSAATESALRSAAATDVLHIASHAVLDPRLDDGAVLLLGGDAQHDGLLHPRDVAQLTIQTGLTVLSGCSTAAGEEYVGAPVSNLAGAFLLAGSGTVLATLWEVDDALSVIVMEQFYAQLARGRSPHRALHEARRRLIEAYGPESAAALSAWVVYGSPNVQIFAPAKPRLARWVPVAGLVLLGAILLWRWRRAR